MLGSLESGEECKTKQSRGEQKPREQITRQQHTIDTEPPRHRHGTTTTLSLSWPNCRFQRLISHGTELVWGVGNCRVCMGVEQVVVYWVALWMNLTAKESPLVPAVGRLSSHKSQRTRHQFRLYADPFRSIRLTVVSVSNVHLYLNSNFNVPM